MTKPVQMDDVASRTWRVTAYIYAPMLSTSPTPPQVGEQLTFAGRLVPTVIPSRDLTVALVPSGPNVDTGQQLPLGVELAFLVADVTGSIDALQATDAAIEAFEALIDSLAFQLGGSINLGQFEVVDITVPLNVGDEREIKIFSGPPSGTNIRSVEMESIRGAISVSLPDQVPDYDQRTAAVLRWFTKSMSTNLLHDAFIFLWIALEILVDLSPISVEDPYRARCNHLIKHCPECGTSTVREVRGATIRRYLEVSFGLNRETSGALWRIRQMMHGSINFEADKLQDLPKLIQPLRAAVAQGLKRQLGIDTFAAPVISSTGATINPAMSVGGTRTINFDDLKSLPDKVRDAQQSSADNASEDLDHESPASS